MVDTFLIFATIQSPKCKRQKWQEPIQKDPKRNEKQTKEVQTRSSRNTIAENRRSDKETLGTKYPGGEEDRK